MMEYQEMLQIRKQRGVEIAKTGKVRYNQGKWLVPSQSINRCYEVILKIDKSECTCQDFAERGIKCKHIFAVEITLSRKRGIDGSITEVKKITYKQVWPKYDKAQTQQKELFLKLLNDLCNTIDEPAYTFGRPKMPLRDMVFSSALKVFTTFSLRRFMTDMRTATENGYVKKTPHFSSVSVYMKKPELTHILKELITLSSLPLKTVENNSFSIDSSGITPSKFSRWFDHKWGKEHDRKIWYKVHLLIGNKTQIACGVEITSQYTSDIKLLPQLVEETTKNFNIKELDGDKAYLSRPNFELLTKLGITPYIPFKENSVALARSNRLWRNMYNYFALNQDIFLERFHQRSNIETAFFMIKSKFGSFVRSKTETACVNEILLKVLCHNICVVIQEMFELGIEPDFLGA